jgi:hypothetical protein
MTRFTQTWETDGNKFEIDVDIKWRYDYNFISEYSWTKREVTICTIKTKDGSIYEGRTYRSAKDKDNKEYARKISLERAMKAANFDRVERAILWDLYRNSTKVKKW